MLIRRKYFINIRTLADNSQPFSKIINKGQPIVSIANIVIGKGAGFDRRKLTVVRRLIRYFEECLSDDLPDSDADKEIEAAYFRYSFKIESDPAVVARDKAVLMALVEERNHLAHTFLQRWKPLSDESTEAAIAYLDNQYAQATPVRDHLKSALDALVEGRKQTVEYMMSEEGSRQFELAWLQQSRLVQLLAQIALTSARADGWTFLSKAGDLLQQLAPEEKERLKERYGHATLKPLLIASELFEVEDEPTEGGGSRVIYRVRPELVSEQL